MNFSGDKLIIDNQKAGPIETKLFVSIKDADGVNNYVNPLSLS